MKLIYTIDVDEQTLLRFRVLDKWVFGFINPADTRGFLRGNCTLYNYRQNAASCRIVLIDGSHGSVDVERFGDNAYHFARSSSPTAMFVSKLDLISLKQKLKHQCDDFQKQVDYHNKMINLLEGVIDRVS